MKRLAFMLLLFAFALTGCNQSKHTEPQTPQATAATVDTVAVVSRKLDTTIILPAQLLPYEAVDVYPKVTGFIDSISVDRGSRVKKGQVLISLTAPELVAQRSQAEAAVHAAESQLAAAEAKLAADQGTYLHLASAAKTPGVVAENDLMVANQMAAADKGAVGAAEQNVTAARETLRSVSQLESYLKIEAPFDGVVTTRNLHPGALVGPASGQSGAIPIVQIVNTNRLRLVVPVPEAEAVATHAGQQVTFTTPGYPGQSFHAPITRISHAVELNTRTMPVELDVQNRNGLLSPGSFANVLWPVQRAGATLFVPLTAVTSDQQRSFAIRVREGKAEWVPVQTGQTSNSEAEVFGDLHAGDQVVRIATDSIRSGQSVNAKATSK